MKLFYNHREVKKAMVTIEDAEKVLTRPKGWWAYLTCLFFAKRLSAYIVNNTKITPNQITTGSLVVKLLSAVFFFLGPAGYLFAAFFYWLAYMLDCVDGTVARLRGTSSLYGGYYDAFTDYFAELLIVVALSYSFQQVEQRDSIYVLSTVYMFLYMYFCFDGKFISELLRFPKIILPVKRNPYFSFFDQREMVAHPRKIEAAATMFVVGPISGHIIFFYSVGVLLLLCAVLLKVYINFSRLYSPLSKFKVITFLRALSKTEKDLVVLGLGREWYHLAILDFVSHCGFEGKIKLLVIDESHYSSLSNINVCLIDNYEFTTKSYYLIPCHKSLKEEEAARYVNYFEEKKLTFGEDFCGFTFPEPNQFLYHSLISK